MEAQKKQFGVLITLGGCDGVTRQGHSPCDNIMWLTVDERRRDRQIDR